MKNIWRIIYCLPYGLIIYGMTIKDWDGFIYLIMLSLFYSFLLMCAITMLQQIVLACNHTSFAYEIVLFSIIVYMISVKNDEVVLWLIPNIQVLLGHYVGFKLGRKIKNKVDIIDGGKQISSIISVIVAVVLTGTFLFYFVIYGDVHYLSPKSPNGVQLYAKNVGFGFDSCSHVYVRYSLFNSKDTGVVFWEDDGPSLYGKDADYKVEWIDDSHVSVSFKGSGYSDYKTEIIEY